MTRIGATTPELMRRVVAATYRIEKQTSIDDANDPIRDVGRINVRNVSAFTIPEFGLMQIKSSTNQDRHTIIDVERPFSQSLPSSIFLINGPFEILASELGTAQTGPIFSVKKDSGTYVEGTRLGWTSDSFEASQGCLFTVIGVDINRN